jgi:hypothetical protein
MDQLLKKLHTQFKLLEDLTDLTPEEEKEFKERMAAERERESRYQEYKRSQQGDDSSDGSSDVTKMSASELVKELHTALDREGIDIPESGGNPVEDILAAIQTYKKSMNLPTDADALVKLFRLTPPTTPGTSTGDPNNREPKQDAYPNVKPTTPDPTDMGGASEFGGAPAKPEEEEPLASKFGYYAANALGKTIKQHYNMAKQVGQYGLDALSGAAKGAVKGWDSVKEDHTTSRNLSESAEMSLLVLKLKRLDETTELNEVRFPSSVEQAIEKYGWTFGKKSLSQLADELGQFPKLIIDDGVEIATPWVRQADNYYKKAGSDVRLDAREMAAVIKSEKELFKKTFGVPKGTQTTVTDPVHGTTTTYTKQPDGTWMAQDGTVFTKAEVQSANLEKRAQQELAGTTPSTTNTNPNTTNPTSSIVSPQRAKELAAETNFLKTNSLPANLSWLAKSKKFLKYTAALTALGLVFDNGELIMKGVKKVLGLGDTDPAGAGGAAGDTAATDAKNSEEIKKLVKEIQDLENAHGKDSDPAWSKAVEHANAVFKRLGIAPFDNSIPKPKPVAPAPKPVAPPPVAAAPAIPPETVVPQDMVQPVDLQQNYQQPQAYQQNSNTFIPVPIPLGGFGGRGGGGRGPQNGRGYPGAGGQLRGGVGTPGGGNRGGRR